MIVNISFDTSSVFFRRVFAGSALLAAFICFGLAAYAATWTGPTGTPPANNVDAPINVGGTSQTKSGALGVNGFHNSGSSQIDGNLGVGVAPSGWRINAQGAAYGIYGDATTGQAIRGEVKGGGNGYAGWFDAANGGGATAGGLFARNGSGYYAYLGYPGSNWSVYANGPTYTGSYSRADGGFCIGGSCKTSWAPTMTTATCSAYGYYQAGCTATCPSGYVLTGGGCGTSGSEWYVWQSYPSGNGWYCAGQEDYGASQYNQYVYGYARCMN